MPPPSAGQPATEVPGPAAIPSVFPIPQEVQIRPGILTIPAVVGQIVGADTDSHALRVLAEVLRAAGVARVVSGEPGRTAPQAELIFYVGTPADNPEITRALANLNATGPEGLASGGYVLAAGQEDGQGTIVLAGVDDAGAYYAVQTLRQLLADANGHPRIREMVIRDWPAMGVRGVVEAFYGPPWSISGRASHFAFEGAKKMNTYVYSPKDDPYLRARWRDSYPADQLQILKALVEQAAANHVNFIYALSPGLSICYSSEADLQHLLSKLQDMWDIGVRTFALFFDDISYLKWNCPGDEAIFGMPDPGHAAAAQAHVTNAVVRHFINTHPGARPLQFVPTEYYDTSPSPYKQVIASALDHSVILLWTGESVVAPRITGDHAALAKEVFNHPVLVCDNYPVNDYARNRLFMGPYAGRTPDLADKVEGILANPMIEEKASRLALSTVADYAWNPIGYGHDPGSAWQAAIRSSNSRAARALGVFADSNYSSILDSQESPGLAQVIKGFWAAHTAGSHQDWLAAADRLQAFFTEMADSAADLRADLGDTDFVCEIRPWLAKLGCYGRAGNLAVSMMLADRAGDWAVAAADLKALEAERSRLAAMPEQVASGVMDTFLAEVLSQGRTCPAAILTLTCSLPVTRPGDPPGYPARVMTTVTGTITNSGESSLSQVAMSLSVPPGWRATQDGPRRLGPVMPGHSASVSWTLHSPAAPTPGPTPLVGWADLRADPPSSGAVMASTTVWVPHRSLAAIFDNVGVTDDNDVAPSGLNGGLDGDGASLSAQALSSERITPGVSFTAAGFSFAWPDVPPGRPNNALANGQCVALPGTGSALAILSAATHGPLTATATILYTDGTTQSMAISSSDWLSPADPSAELAVSAGYHNAVGAGQIARPAGLFVTTAALQPGKTAAAVILPVVSSHATKGAPSLHVFALAVK